MKSALCRVFGAKTELLINREKDNRASTVTSPACLRACLGVATTPLTQVACVLRPVCCPLFVVFFLLVTAVPRARGRRAPVVFQQLSDLEFGPFMHGAFGNGRVEGWVTAGPLEPPQMAEVRTASKKRSRPVANTALCHVPSCRGPPDT